MKARSVLALLVFSAGGLAPAWFLPVLVLAQSKPLPLHLATPATAQYAVAAPETHRRNRDRPLRLDVLTSLADNPFAP